MDPQIPSDQPTLQQLNKELLPEIVDLQISRTNTKWSSIFIQLAIQRRQEEYSEKYKNQLMNGSITSTLLPGHSPQVLLCEFKGLIKWSPGFAIWWPFNSDTVSK